jgi:hypothetical protein
MAYGVDANQLAAQITSGAANLPSSNSAVYTADDFYNTFPQFCLGPESAVQITDDVFDMFLSMANASIQQSRWNTKWSYAMGLYIAHFLTLWLQTQNGAGGTAASVIATAHSVLTPASKSVGDVSVSYDTSTMSGSLPGWGAWLTTTYGQQLAMMGRYLPGARAGMMV